MKLHLGHKCICITGFPGGSGSKESACNAGDPVLIPGREDYLEKEMAAHSSTLARRIPWTGTRQATALGVAKSQT